MAYPQSDIRPTGRIAKRDAKTAIRGFATVVLSVALLVLALAATIVAVRLIVS